MKPKVKFQIGSSYFFGKYDDYHSKDYDDLCIMDTFNFPGKRMMNMKIKGKDVFMFRDMDKQGFIDDLKETNVYMKAGKFLIPEFNEYIGFTIDDLKSIMEYFEQIDYPHKYEKVIADAYIENNSFTLTDEQRQKAYDVYKHARKYN